MEIVRPVVGLTARTLTLRSSHKDRPAETVARAYVEALEQAGARPLLLPNVSDAAAAAAYLDLLDGLVLTGGDDPHPRFFGEDPHPRIERVDARRDAFEIALVKEARARLMPVLGICRGVQIMNIALGGDIYQDVVSQTDSGVCHNQQTTDDGPWHDVEVSPGSVLARYLGAGPLAVNSFHHQACRRMGRGLEATATTMGDGLVEAVEDPSLPFFVGVQWHPEIGFLEDQEPARALFKGFVEAAREAAGAASKSRRSTLSPR